MKAFIIVLICIAFLPDAFSDLLMVTDIKKFGNSEFFITASVSKTNRDDLDLQISVSRPSNLPSIKYSDINVTLFSKDGNAIKLRQPDGIQNYLGWSNGGNTATTDWGFYYLTSTEVAGKITIKWKGISQTLAFRRYEPPKAEQGAAANP